MAGHRLTLNCLVLSTALAVTQPAAAQMLGRGVGLEYSDVSIGRLFGLLLHIPSGKKCLFQAGVTYFVNENPLKHGLGAETGDPYYKYYPTRTIERFGLRLGVERPALIRGTTAHFSPFIRIHGQRMPLYRSVYVPDGTDTSTPFRESVAWHQQHDEVTAPRVIGTAHGGVSLAAPVGAKLLVRVHAGVGLRAAFYKKTRDAHPLARYGVKEDSRAAFDRAFGVGVEYRFAKKPREAQEAGRQVR